MGAEGVIRRPMATNYKLRRRDNFHELAPSSKRRITLSLIRLRAGLKTL
jgi:hypothetical protein